VMIWSWESASSAMSIPFKPRW